MSILRVCVALVALGLVSACASMPDLSSLPGVGAQEESAAPVDGAAGARDRVRRAAELLDAGQERAARAELRAVLAAQPNHRTARLLMDQIEANPRTMLGERSRPYTVRAGETMSELAERFLGDPLLFYALARYNDLQAPNQLSAGQVLSIPQRAVTRAAVPPVAGAGSTTASVTPRETPMPAPPAAVAAVDPSRAGQLRLQALQRLNTGDVGGAVTLLRQAQALDAGNVAIQRDLDRALRMQASLQPATRTN